MGTKKMREQSGQQFEAFYAEHEKKREANGWMPLEAHVVVHMRNAWVASREAVVVELPSACAYEGLIEQLGSVIELSYEAPEHDPVGLARLPDVRYAIQARGLKVAP